MWFNYALSGKEKIHFLFNNELSLNDIYFDKLIFCNIRTVDLEFCIGNIPEVCPEKWKKRGFNALAMRLSYIGIDSLQILSDRIGFICTPNIFVENNSIHTIINSQNNRFEIIGGSMNIADIQPVQDNRF